MIIMRRTGSPHSIPGAQVAAGDRRAEAEDRPHHEHVGDDAGDDAEDEAPVHVEAGDDWSMSLGGDRARRGLVQARRVAHRPLDEVIEEGDGDVVEEQAADRLVDAAIGAQRAREADPGAAHRERRRSPSPS